MDYIYDIVLNFQNEYYDFYEWQPTDKIINIKRLPIYKISHKDYLNIKKNNITIVINTLPKPNKIFLVTSGIEVMGVLIDNHGKISKKSSLLFDEADEILKGIRKEYRDATHNVPALVTGDKMQIQWASDDGEPQGTSGAPMLMKMVNEGITNSLIVVTRYFGGTKLGTGGLVRAYTKAADAGLKAAGICEVHEMDELTLKTSYSYLSRLQKYADMYGYRITDTVYEENITMKVVADPENTDAVIGHLTDMTGGETEIFACEKTVEKVPIIY